MWIWRPIQRGPVLGLCLGLIFGGAEAIGCAVTAPISLDVGQGILWGLLSVLLGGLVGSLAGVVGGALAEWGLRRAALPARHAVATAGAGFFLCGWHLWPMAMEKLQQGLPIPAVAIALTPVGVSGVFYFNAHYWLRREELGEQRRVGFTLGSILMGLAFGSGAGIWLATQDQGSSKALDVDPHVLIITVEGLERADLAAFSESTVPTPHIDALAAQGVRFHEAISPMPETGPAHVALLTARHPVRVGVWSDEHTLGRAWPLLPDVLRREGYATGAFVSTLAAGDHTGLARGFGVYDDDRWSHWLPAGAEELRLVRTVEALLMRFVPDLVGWPRLMRRPDAETVARAEAWIQRHASSPLFAWAHLADLDVASPEPRLERIKRLDDQIGRLVNALGPDADGRPRLIAMMGVGAGERATGGVAEARIRVPLILVPKKLRIHESDVYLTVRTMDVPATVLAQLGLKPFDQVDGTDLGGFAEGTKSRGYASLLAARVQTDRVEPVLELGYRAGRKGTTTMIKGIVRPATGRVALYDLGDDPREEVDLASQQAEAMAELEGHARGEAGAARDGMLPPRTVPAGIARVLRFHRFGM